MKFIKEYGKMFTIVLLLLTYIIAAPGLSIAIAAPCFIITIMTVLTVVSENIVVSRMFIGFAWLLIVYYCIEIYKYAEILQLKASPLVT